MPNSKPQVMWAARNLLGKLEYGCLGYTRNAAINIVIKYVIGNPKDWPTLYRLGWRIVKVEVRETKGDSK